MWASLSKLTPLPPDTLVYCAHEYTASNAKFAVHVDEGNQGERQLPSSWPVLLLVVAAHKNGGLLTPLCACDHTWSGKCGWMLDALLLTCTVRHYAVRALLCSYPLCHPLQLCSK